jgi:hypothetical protein
MLKPKNAKDTAKNGEKKSTESSIDNNISKDRKIKLNQNVRQ